MVMTSKRGIGALAMVAAGALALSACASGTPTDNNSNTNAPAPSETGAPVAKAGDVNPQPRTALQEGGTLKTAIVEINEQFNTFHADGSAYTLALWRWYNPTLFLFDPDGTAHANEDYISEYKTEEKDGNTVVTYKLNPKAVFNDGTPLDYKAFETTWKANNGTNDAYIPSSTDGYERIKSVEKGADDREVIVTFDGVYAWVEGLFNNVLHPKAADPEFYNTAYIKEPHPELGAGPYKLKKYDSQNGTISFERNEKWWGDKGLLDERIFVQMEDSAEINAFKNGEVDAAGVANKDRLAQVKDMQGIQLRESSTPSNSLYMLNAGNDLLKDQNVRQAIIKSIDRETLVKIRFQGMDYKEPLPGSFTLFPNQPGYENNFADAGLDADKEAAAKLLKDAGWEAGSDGVLAKDGKKLAITLPLIGDNPINAALGKAMQAMLKEVGITLNITERPSADFGKVFSEREFDLFLMGFGSSDPYGYAYFCQIYCSDSGLNVSGTGTKEMDEKIRAIAAIGDPEEQIKQGNALETELFKLGGIVPMFNGPTIVAIKEKLANFGENQRMNPGFFYVGKIQDIGWMK